MASGIAPAAIGGSDTIVPVAKRAESGASACSPSMKRG